MQNLVFLCFLIPVLANLFYILLFCGEFIFERNKINNKYLFIITICFLVLLDTLQLLNLIPFLITDLFLINLSLIHIICIASLSILIYLLISISINKNKKQKFYSYISLAIVTLVIFFIFLKLNNNYSGKLPSSFCHDKHLYFKSINIVILLFFQILVSKDLIKFYRNEYKKFRNDSVNWLYIIVFLFLLLCIISSFRIYSILYVFTFNLISFTLSYILCYNLFTNRLLIPVKKFTSEEKVEKIYQTINKEKFEKYITDQKPYLNSELKISDFTKHIGTNRTYLSRFINITYGMSFSDYINTLRLKEFYILKSLPQNKELSNEELIFMAGFKSYQNYQKILKKDINPP